MIERQHLCIVANAPGKIKEEVTRATQAGIDCVYLAQLPTQSDRSLEAYRAAHARLMEDRWGWVRNGTRRGKKVVIPHFNIPKMHVIRHLDDHVRRKGSADNYSTETMEHLHVDVKDAYRASNRREWKKQTTRWLTRRERIRDFEAWMEWCKLESERSASMQADPTCGQIPTEANEAKSETTSVHSSQAGEVDGSEGESAEEQSSERGRDEYGEQLNDESKSQGDSAGERANESESGILREGECESLGVVEGASANVGVGVVVGAANQRVSRTYPHVENPTGNQKVQNWLLAQASVEVEEVETNNRKRKRPADEDASLTRHQPRPRLQDTHGISDLQKINQDPSDRQKSIEDTCKKYGLDLEQMLHEIKRSPYLTTLPTTIDQYTRIDTWYALRVHARPPKIGSSFKIKMQRIRSKPGAQNDPVFYVSSENTPVSTAKLKVLQPRNVSHSRQTVLSVKSVSSSD
ncbi:hypothetical protein FRC07_000513 [Ceratobasidium sp. 392]|nr:hypothetical protein FRC07_000513 [Ceratobasidium sp. 392]